MDDYEFITSATKKCYSITMWNAEPIHLISITSLPTKAGGFQNSRYLCCIVLDFRQGTHTHTTILQLSGFCLDNPGASVLEETFTHSHLLWSSVIPYLLSPFITSHDILPVQFTCLRVYFHNLSPSFLWSTSWPGTLNFILHTFLHPITGWLHFLI